MEFHDDLYDPVKLAYKKIKQGYNLSVVKCSSVGSFAHNSLKFHF